MDRSHHPIEPWQLRETELDLDRLEQAESLFSLSNGHIGLRGNLDEGEPFGIPGTYLNSFYESRPLPYAEAGYGYPESGQTLVDVTNGKLIRLLVDDSPFDVRYGDLHSHERVLDFRSGILQREADWTSPGGKRIKVRSRRLVSLTQRAVVAIEYVVEPVDQPTRFVVQSELVANETQPRLSDDPRVAAVLENPLEPVSQHGDREDVVLVHRTRKSEQLMAAGMAHEVEADTRVKTDVDVQENWARSTVICELKPGQSLRVVKYVAYGWSSLRSETAIGDQVAAALAGAQFSGWDGLVQQQREFLDDFWDAADVEVHGHAELQQAVRFALFHVLQAGARAERRAIPSKGLTGAGYDGHTFWDTEGFVLPTLTYTMPDAAADALRWRHSILPLAKERASVLGLRGAAFPWRTIRGQECSGYWPAGTAAFHINADIAEAVTRYYCATSDDKFMTEVGIELLVETARLWMSLGHHDRDGQWHLPGVTGPDEYSAVADDNVFTNLMAARNLRAAARYAAKQPAKARELGVDAEEEAAWRDAAAAVYVPYDAELGVHPQSAGFTRYAEWDFEASRGKYPLMLHAPYFELYRKQVVKQADLMLATYWCGDAFTAEEKARNFDYYERLTVRDSSLSACVQAVAAAEVGHLDLAFDYAYEAALIDLLDLHSNSGDGLHMASLAGAWMAMVAGFGGLRERGGMLSFDPALPDGLSQLAFSVRWRGVRLRVEAHHREVRYAVHDGPDAQITFLHAGEEITVTADAPVTRPLTKRVPLMPRPSQPPGREPMSALGQHPAVESEQGQRSKARANAGAGPTKDAARTSAAQDV
ncbi:glycoside hydrolase family 65 central catalytic [Kribbella flavida DSM 17836]|uniref:Glycoside hydrolase family 65 central catalytic n=1 Tax=Kribbella flavida (strain DSM 17836 / JCM 10339 / NBRC 14399) TaxID=479435 RepID=D2PX15_KRIFD|nr:glycosyl hydrolase family 65 protein [Kribbella flavida]ADB35395.1 glycoside hydrolase family 65 central catalytic [Kribbella flavida DSM 17836]